MKGIIVYNGFLKSEKFMQHIKLFCEAFREKNVDITAFANSEFCVIQERGKTKIKTEGKVVTKAGLGISQSSDREKNKNNSGFLGCQEVDFVIFYDKDLSLARAFESLGIRLFNCAKCVLLCDDKALTSEVLAGAGVSIPKTIIPPNTFKNIGYTDFGFLKSAEGEISYPMIVKKTCSSFGEGVFLAKDRAEVEGIFRENPNENFVLQEFIKESRGRDLRINVVGENIFGCVERASQTGDFRSNATLGGKMKKVTPTHRQCKLAIDAARAVGADFAGVDILSDSLGDYVCEVNSNPHFVKVFKTTGVNLAEIIAEHILEKLNKK